MNEISPPDMVYGALALAAVLLMAAWHEFAAKNPRDAKLLVAMGAASLTGGTVAWLQ
ncbi:MAG: hypothetical protein KAX88_04670 [Rhodoferax sp.]|jgi:hypothetical protein|nr:hypothetical protein [Rhodoferax sp.]MBP8183374.1 hypothetical protein [Rhodoferax sp.]